MLYSQIKFDFSNKNVLVAGGSRGIGNAVLEAFANAGANTFYASRKPAKNFCGAAHHIETDLLQEQQIISMFKEIDQYGHLDILVNTAAINYAERYENIPPDQWDEVMAVNLRAAFLMTREAVKRMKKKYRGKIVHVSSIAGRHRSIASGTHYVTSKAGLNGLVRQFAFDCAAFNIHINATCPSQTYTEMLEKTMPPEAIKKLENSIPLQTSSNH